VDNDSADVPLSARSFLSGSLPLCEIVIVLVVTDMANKLLSLSRPWADNRKSPVGDSCQLN